MTSRVDELSCQEHLLFLGRSGIDEHYEVSRASLGQKH
jgi:hypothetical protein